MFKHEERIIPDRYYGEFYSTYANYLGRYAFAARFLSGGATVIDLGCGCGYGTAYLAEAPVRSVVGIDRSTEATQYARKRFVIGGLSFLAANAADLPIRPDSVDAVVAMEMIEHVEKAEAVVEEIRRVLKPDGLCVLSTPNRWVTGTIDKPLNPFHVKEYAPEELRAMLDQSFDQVTLYGQAYTPAVRAYQENMARIWHNLALIPALYEQLQALQSRVAMDERITGLSLLRKLKRKLFGQPSVSEKDLRAPTHDLNQEFRHAQALVNSMLDWDISPYEIDSAPVLMAVCRKLIRGR